jgi:antitoxin (DNA-binding transcriptional repressor) of toxin-antitoxin stability system
MTITISAKELRASLPKVVERVRKGARFTVLYRSRRAFQIVPVDEPDPPRDRLDSDSLYRAGAVGRSTDGRSAADHDAVLYGR